MKVGSVPVKPHPMEIMSGIMSGEAARSLELLRAIDGTVEALVYTRRNMEALSETCESLIRRAKTDSMEGEPLVEEVIPSLVEVQSSSRMALEIMQARCRIARLTPELGADDGVVEAYEQVIASIVGLISRVDTLMNKVNERLARSRMTPLERKLERNRSPLISQDTLDSVARGNAAFLIELGKKSRAK